MISNVLKHLIKNQKKNVTFSGIPLTLEEATSANGGMPIFFKQSELIVEAIDGDQSWLASIGTIKDDPNSLFGQTVELSEDFKNSKVLFSPVLLLLSEAIKMAANLSPGDSIDLVEITTTQDSKLSEVFNVISRQRISGSSETESSSPRN